MRHAVFFNSAKKALKPITIFAGLEDAVLGELAKRRKKIQPEIDDVIFEENAIGSEMFLISEGRVRIIGKRGTPNETTLTELGPGEFFGEMCLIERTPRSASAVAIEESVLFSLADCDIEWLMKSRPD